ncbi:MAG: CRISPR-associated helicase Cas3' [Clostridia bacterium]|jgi:CRISPR-associated endonuclease/helicase Cas3|nr:CRISPR-associated helicase Cas3' [Clostridia bacterium]
MYYAHKENKGGFKEPVCEHLRETAKLVAQFSAVWGREAEGKATGKLHDIGKYTALFDDVLEGKAHHVDHATPGAAAMLMRYKAAGIAGALAIQGHHDGLQIGVSGHLKESLKMTQPISLQNKTYSSRDIPALLEWFRKDRLELPDTIYSDYPAEYMAHRQVAAMLYVRMLFSALVDADFLATEAHYASHEKGGYHYRPAGAVLKPNILLTSLLNYMDSLRRTSTANEEINSLRNDLFNACLNGGKKPKGIYTLTAPTGAGKTLAMLAFALQHAATHQIRRIIFVLPYLNIIEQNAQVYREVFKDWGSTLILEDHSQAELPEEQRLLAENWDAPIIVTTTIRFFEGLFANRSSPCRRLHNIANSIILFDEAQSIPPPLAVYTLAALSYLVDRFGCSTVFSTATQPPFEVFHDKVKQHTTKGWQPNELIPKELNLFQRTRKIKVSWRSHETWENIAKEIAKKPQALAVVNTKKQARTLYQLVKECPNQDEKLFFLSTDMCPAHRLKVIQEVKEQSKCRLISTQCVEAGVDLDFPVVWRTLGPLEAIVQAAGRCNRQGLLPFGKVIVFRPPKEDERFPDPTYGKGAFEVQVMLERYGELELNDPESIREYYHRFFLDNLHRFDKVNLAKAFEEYDFLKVAHEYRWIPDTTINILVPYSEEIETFDELRYLANVGEFSRDWIKKARPLSVGYRLKKHDKLISYLDPVTINDKRTDWFILNSFELYNERLGLVKPTEEQHAYGYIAD